MPLKFSMRSTSRPCRLPPTGSGPGGDSMTRWMRLRVGIEQGGELDTGRRHQSRQHQPRLADAVCGRALCWRPVRCALIRGWLKAGVVEDAVRQPATKGTPQGAVISPLPANIYLHYAYDLWTTQWRNGTRGAMIVVRCTPTTRSLVSSTGLTPNCSCGTTTHPHGGTCFGVALGRRLLPDRVRSLEPHPTGRRGDGCRDVRLPGFTHICSRFRGRALPACPAHAARSETGEVARDHRGTSTTMAPKRSRTGRVARVGGPGLQCLPRRAHKHARSVGVPALCCRTLATLMPAQPERSDDMDDGGQVGAERWLPKLPGIPSLAVSTLPRQTPTVEPYAGMPHERALCGARSNARPYRDSSHR